MKIFGIIIDIVITVCFALAAYVFGFILYALVVNDTSELLECTLFSAALYVAVDQVIFSIKRVVKQIST